MKATHSCPHVNIKIQGIDFSVDPVVLGSNGIDVILGCNWLKSCDGVTTQDNSATTSAIMALALVISFICLVPSNLT
jgi:hypothetical protein